MLQYVKRWLERPELAGLDLDDPRTTALRKRLIQDKPFLKRLYAAWYAWMREAAGDAPEGLFVELGAGPGFLKEVIPGVCTSDLFVEAQPDLVCSGEALPFGEASISALFLQNVFHHLPRPASFLAEAERCLKPGGKVIMIEPCNTWWGRQVWRRLHHEAFLPEAAWESVGERPLSDANGALPWIVLQRDRRRFEAAFPGLKVARFAPFMPIAYLLSGGVSMRSLAPGWSYPMVRAGERVFHPWAGCLGMFAQIELVKAAANREF